MSCTGSYRIPFAEVTQEVSKVGRGGRVFDIGWTLGDMWAAGGLDRGTTG